MQSWFLTLRRRTTPAINPPRIIMSMTKTRMLMPMEWWNWKKEIRAQAVPTREAMKRTRISAGVD